MGTTARGWNQLSVWDILEEAWSCGKTGACHIILTLQIIDKILHDKKYTNKLAIAKTATGRPPNHDSSAVTPLNTDACILEGVLEDNLKGATGWWEARFSLCRPTVSTFVLASLFSLFPFLTACSRSIHLPTAPCSRFHSLYYVLSRSSHPLAASCSRLLSLHSLCNICSQKHAVLVIHGLTQLNKGKTRCSQYTQSYTPEHFQMFIYTHMGWCIHAHTVAVCLCMRV
jgi:hypothetical protein